MRPLHRVPCHPGEVLREEFLKPLNVSQAAFADHLGVPVRRIQELVREKRAVTAEDAWLLAQAFGTSPEFWLNLQAAHDLATVRRIRRVRKLRMAG